VLNMKTVSVRRIRPSRGKRPDFAVRLKRIYGDKVPLPNNPVIRDREEGRW
jgi:hypothetical protein